MKANDPARLVGQHPAALRSVHFGGSPSPAVMGHLEVETKHGHVLVFDHQTPTVYACPPAPDDAGGRSWHDLTERVPEAFDGRPVFAGIALTSHDARPCWEFELSTGAKLKFVLDPSSPLLLPIRRSQQIGPQK